MNRILIIDADRDITDLIGDNLRLAGFEILTAHDGLEGIRNALHGQPDLIIMDVLLPNRDGYAVLHELRNDPRADWIPVILLTALHRPEDRIRGLEAGADDYLTKPFNPRELVLRVQAVLKRSKAPFGAGDLVHGPFRFQTSSLEFLVDDQPIKLTTIEIKLLLYLCEHPGQPLDRGKLLRTVWGHHSETYSRTLDTHMKRLRKKLGDHGDWIETVRGSGYRIVESREEPLKARTR